MKLSSIASGCSLLVRTADFHWQRACDYSRLFNVGDRGGINLTYTPLQKFYERMANHHICAYYRAKRLIQEFEETADAELLKAETGQDSANEGPDNIEPLPIPGAGKWL